MDADTIVTFLQESVYLIIVFAVFLALAILKGKQALINVTLGLYFALLLSLEFPYYETLLGNSNAGTEAVFKLIIFAVFATISTMLFNHLMPREFEESKFEGFGKKILFAAGATILVMAFSFHVLPVTEFLTPGTPIQMLFAPEEYFFWWIVSPIAILFLL